MCICLNLCFVGNILSGTVLSGIISLIGTVLSGTVLSRTVLSVHLKVKYLYFVSSTSIQS